MFFPAVALFGEPWYNVVMMDFMDANRKAWNKEANTGNAWSRPVDDSMIEEAARGDLDLRLAITNCVPKSWTDGLVERDVLNLGGGGGQQTVLLSAYGCNVTTVDLSDEQIRLDDAVLKAHGLCATLHNASLTDLSFLADGSFDCVIAPGSLNFVPSLSDVYAQVHRLLRSCGRFMFSVANPALYMFDQKRLERGVMKVKYTLPFSSESSLSRRQLESLVAEGGTIEYSHTLDEVFGSLCSEGFLVKDYLSSGSDFEPIDSFLKDCYFSILAVKEG